MKASIIIPAYNEGKFLRATLEAATQQDYQDYEVIVVDNNSKDDTFEVASSFAGVKVVKELNGGTNWARECGRKEAMGEIIAMLDADCIAPKHWLSEGVKIISSKPNIAAVSGPYDYYDTAFALRFVTAFTQRYVYNLTSKILNFLGTGGVIIGGNCIAWAKYLEQMGGFDTSYKFYGDDTDTAKRLSRYGKVLFSNKIYLKSSGRRFERQGVVNLTYKYFINFVKVLFSSSKK